MVKTYSLVYKRIRWKYNANILNALNHMDILLLNLSSSVSTGVSPPTSIPRGNSHSFLCAMMVYEAVTNIPYRAT